MAGYRESMKAKFRREYRFSGAERFRGVVVWMVGEVKNTVACDHTRGTKALAMADANELLAYLRTSEWTA